MSRRVRREAQLDPEPKTMSRGLFQTLPRSPHRKLGWDIGPRKEASSSHEPHPQPHSEGGVSRTRALG